MGPGEWGVSPPTGWVERSVEVGWVPHDWSGLDDSDRA